MNGDETVGQGGSDMHWTAVDADDESRVANQPDQLEDTGMIEEVDTILGRG